LINVSTFTIVDCPPDAVFAFLTNVELYPIWQVGITAVSVPPEGRLDLGARFQVTRAVTGRSLTNVREVAAYEPGVVFGHRSVEGDTEAEMKFLLEPVSSRTKVTLLLRTNADRIMGMAGPLASRIAKRELKAALGNLKDLLENPKLWRSKERS
jgi:uncharacterized membrane protein